MNEDRRARFERAGTFQTFTAFSARKLRRASASAEPSALPRACHLPKAAAVRGCGQAQAPPTLAWT
jgi:hypothetical protein